MKTQNRYTMKKTLLAMSAFGLAAMSAYGYTWPSSGTVTIPSGETYTAAEADMANVNSLAKIVFADSTAKVVFTGSTAPAIPFEGVGTIEKDSSSDWTLSVAAGGSFKGTYVLRRGIVTPSVGAAFGYAEGTSDSVTLKILSGATLKLANGMNGILQLKNTKIRIAGNGANSKGAIWVLTNQDTNTDDVKNIALDSDASIFLDGSNCYYYHKGTLELNDHNLTITGNGPYYMQDVTITGGGAFIYPDTYTSRTLCLRGVCDFVPKGDGTMTKVVMNGKQYINYYQGGWGTAELMPPQRYELDVNGPEVTVQHNHQFVHVSPGEYKDHVLELAGPIKLKDASSSVRFFVSTSNGSSCSNCMMKVSGQISGAGGVFLNQYDGHTRVYLANTNNTFTGQVFVNGGGLASAAIAAPGTVPNYANVTGAYGRVALMVKNENSAWTPSEIVNFANAATFQHAYLSLDASESEVKEFTMPGSAWSQVHNSELRLSPDGDNVLTLTPPLSDRWYSFNSVDGTLRFSGEGRIQIGSMSAGMPNPDAHAQEVGKILIEDATDVCLTNRMVSLGSTESDRKTNGRRLGEMTIRNSKVTGYVSSSWSTAADTSGIYSGWYADGILTIEDGSDVSSKFVLGGGNADGRGAVIQRGGVVKIQGVPTFGKQNQGSFIGSTGHGYYEISGGTCDLVNCVAVGGDAPACGIISVLGGEARINVASASTGNALVLGNGSGLAHLYIKGGTFSCNSYAYVGMKNGYNVAITIDGPTAHFNQSAQVMYLSKASGGGTINFNLNDGVFEAKYISIDSSASASTPCNLYMNFNGGTLKTMSNGSAYISSRSDGKGYSHIHAFAGGMKVDTDSVSMGASISVPIEQPTGNGVVSIPLPSAVASATQLTGSPEVLITGGGGSGAQAYADYDSTTRKVTGVHVICPGWDYTSTPTATFRMGSTVLGTSTCVIGQNAPGRLVKKGAHTLVLNSANTYTGDTVLEGGTVKGAVEGAIPAGTRAVLSGGTLDCQTFTRPTRYAVDCNRALEIGTIPYADDLVFPEGSTLEVLNADQVGKNGRTKIELLRVADGKTITGKENLVISGGEESRLYVRWVGNILRASRNVGLTVVLW